MVRYCDGTTLKASMLRPFRNSKKSSTLRIKSKPGTASNPDPMSSSRASHFDRALFFSAEPFLNMHLVL